MRARHGAQWSVVIGAVVLAVSGGTAGATAASYDRAPAGTAPASAPPAGTAPVSAAPAGTTSRPATPSAAAPAATPSPRLSLRLGRWTGTATDVAGKHAFSFRVVRRGRGFAIHDLRVSLQERCVDPLGKSPDTLADTAILVERIAVHSTGRFSLFEGDYGTTGMFQGSRRVSGKVESAPIGLTCSGTQGTFRATAVPRARR
jgi:hypothetical protein